MPAMFRALLFLLFLAAFTHGALGANGTPGAFGAGLPLPKPLDAIVKNTATLEPEDVLPFFLGIPYRPDGTINEYGQYTLFAKPTEIFTTPGLNCSGLVLASARILLGKNITIQEALRDRANDSGPIAPLGHDWDFGFDLIMNISEGMNRTVLFPKGLTPSPVAGSKSGDQGALRVAQKVTQEIPQQPGPADSANTTYLTGLTSPAWDPHAEAFVTDFLPRVQRGRIYLVSFSKHKTPTAPALLHYHVGLIYRDKVDSVWIYSTTHNSGKATRTNLSQNAGLARFRQSFKNTKSSFKRLTIIEVQTAGQL